MATEHKCLNCHSAINYNKALCGVCKPWIMDSTDPIPGTCEGLNQMTMLEFLSCDNYQSIISQGMPTNDVAWIELLSEIQEERPHYVSASNGQFLIETDGLLSLITHIQGKIDEYTEQLSRNENLALSYYSHFVDLDKSEILGDDEEKILQFDVQNQNIAFRIVRMKGDDIPNHAYRFTTPVKLYSNYYAEIVSINGQSVNFDYKDLEGCAEVVMMLGNTDLSVKQIVELLNYNYSNTIDRLQSQYKLFGDDSRLLLPNSISIISEIERILKGDSGEFFRELLLCSLYTFDNWKWIKSVLDPATTRSFQFLRQIMIELKDHVAISEKGFQVDSITGNCYQVNSTNFRSDRVFWIINDILNARTVCIEPAGEMENDLPIGDTLAAILLSLYDDVESAELIKTLSV